MRARTRWVVGVAVGALFVAVMPGRVVAAPSTSPGPVTRCQTPIRTEALLPDGSTRSAVDGDSYGRRYTYSSGFREAVAPPGFNPLTASDAALAVYALPPRPVNADALRVWQAQWSGWNDSWRDTTPRMCDLGTRNTLTNGNASSANWAGGMAVNGTANQNTLWDINATFNQPGFV
jgi:hypothetical protein